MDIQTIVGYACSDNGAVLTYVLGAIVGASAIQNGEKLIASKAPWLVPIVDFVALNFSKIIAQKAQTKETK